MQKTLAKLYIFDISYFFHKYNTLAAGLTAASCVRCIIPPLTDSKTQIIYGSLFLLFGPWDFHGEREVSLLILSKKTVSREHA